MKLKTKFISCLILIVFVRNIFAQEPTSQPSEQPTSMPSLQPTSKPSCQPSTQPSYQPTSQPSIQPTQQPSGQPSRQPSSQPTRQPSCQPTSQPSRRPTTQPTGQPSRQPTMQPSRQPTNQPTGQPSRQPTSQPSGQPTRQPSSHPTQQPTTQPSAQPTGDPSGQPSMNPSVQPSDQPSAQPLSAPSAQPSLQPSTQPSRMPTTQPTKQPLCRPSSQPSRQPSRQPTGQPSRQPSRQPTTQPSGQPTTQPSGQPTRQPTGQPSRQPTAQPSGQPSQQPSSHPSVQPSAKPSDLPTAQPSMAPSVQPTSQPSEQPTCLPTGQPTDCPSGQPSQQPTERPTCRPSTQPSSQPSGQPTRQPSTQPSGQPSGQPSSQPSRQPSRQPTSQPSGQPSNQPSVQPSRQPSGQPTRQPSTQPTSQPTRRPSSQPSATPTRQPSGQPTTQPINRPTSQPSQQPFMVPSSQPSGMPSVQPTNSPTSDPTDQPTGQPTICPSVQPSTQPSVQPSSAPTRQPSGQPSRRPTCQPSSRPSRQPSSQPSSRPTMQPSGQPSRQPSSQPSAVPSRQPSSQPIVRPTTQPSCHPSSQPSVRPSTQPSSHPSDQPSLRPSTQPSGFPSSRPSTQPSNKPSKQPTTQPSNQPSSRPSLQPSGHPSGQPSCQPSAQPSRVPSTQPSVQPSARPSNQPSVQPSSVPSRQPTCQPTSQPSAQPLMRPTTQPSSIPSRQPSSAPSRQPSSEPTSQPSNKPSLQPSSQPSARPSLQPSLQPSSQPSSQPMTSPSARPSTQPTTQPSVQPSTQPSEQPSLQPSMQPSHCPSVQPSSRPSRQPSAQPSLQPTCQPSVHPSEQPSSRPSEQPTQMPSSQPSIQPTDQPSMQPSEQPTSRPTTQPSRQPTGQPSRNPSRQPSSQPSSCPSSHPTMQPTNQPSAFPSSQPSRQPSGQPSRQPSSHPSDQPSAVPSSQPSNRPSNQPSMQPSAHPSTQPTRVPTCQPSGQPSQQPTMRPSTQPTGQPSEQPSSQPSSHPSRQPSMQPTDTPSVQPSSQPSCQPTNQPSAQPSKQPSATPTTQPSRQPSAKPSCQPSTQPSACPSAQPSSDPSTQPSSIPTSQPSCQPSRRPTSQPSGLPSQQPSALPSGQPSARPSRQPTMQPTQQPTCQPSARPSIQPSAQPSGQPTNKPSNQPTSQPTCQPSARPSTQPSSHPSEQPSCKPTQQPSSQPTGRPSDQPSKQPTSTPSEQPTNLPTTQPSTQPSSRPSGQPSVQPSSQPSVQPSTHPSTQPSVQPSVKPSCQPTSQPSGYPTSQPSNDPSGQPSVQPSVHPSDQPTCRPSQQPTEQPSRNPSSQPSSLPTMQPSSQPSSRPSDQPSSRPSRQPSEQPSAQPSSYPTPIPSQFSTLSAWKRRLTSELENATISVDSDLSQLLYEDLFYQYEPVVGGCDSWGTFLKSRDLTKALTIQRVVSVSVATVKLLRDHYEIVDQASDTVTCSDSTLSNIIVSRLAGVLPTTSFNATCDGRLWNIRNCTANAPALCIDCADPCVVQCSNARYVNYLSSCQARAPHCVDPVRGTRSGIRDSIHILSVLSSARVVAPKILNITTISTLNAVQVAVSLSSPGSVYCGVFNGDARQYPTFLDQVRLQGNVQFSPQGALRNATLHVFDNLLPATSYLVFCLTEAVSGAHMSYLQMIATGGRNFSTLCCKASQASLSTPYVYRSKQYQQLVTITLNAPPSIFVIASVTVISSSRVATALYPSSLRFTAQSWASQSVSLLSSSKLAAGTYRVAVSLTGPSADEYFSSFYQNRSSLVVLSATAAMPAPQALAAQFSSQGDFVTLTFDAASNMGATTTNFVCSELLVFQLAALSSCRWADSSRLVIYPFVNATGSQYEGLVRYSLLPVETGLTVGSVITLVGSKIQALCTAVSCADWAYSSGGVTVTASVDAATPSLQMSTPSTLGACDALRLDLTSSSGSGGRRWRNASMTVVSSLAKESSIRHLQAFFAWNYTMYPPLEVPRSLLEPMCEFTFIFSACNFLGKCGSTMATVSVLNTTSPYVSIAGSPLRTAKRSDALQLFGNASMVDNCGDSASKASLQYLWTVKRNNLLVSSLNSQSNNPSSLLLPAFSLGATGLYYVYLKATDSRSGFSSSALVKVQVGRGQLVAVVSGASSLSLGLGETLQLDASGSYDEDSADRASAAQLAFVWRCSQLSPNITAHCGVSLNQLNHFSRINVVALAINTTSLVTVTVSDSSNRTSSASVKLKVTTRLLPRFGLSLAVLDSKFSSDSSAYIVRVDRKLKIEGWLSVGNTTSLVAASYPALTAAWSVDDPSLDLSESALTPVVKQVTPLLLQGVGRVAFDFTLNENVLQRSNKYTFSLRVLRYIASVTVLVNAPPQPGQFSVAPAIGDEMVTQFSFVASGWQDSDLPLSFSFGYLSDSNALQTMAARSEFAYTFSVLPALTRGAVTSPLYANARVFDSLDSFADSSFLVAIRPNATTLLTSVEQQLAAARSDYQLLKRTVSVLSTALASVDCSLATSCATSYNRNKCYSKINTCGACLAGFIGVQGTSNSVCVAATSTRRLLSVSSSSSSPQCASFSDCAAFETCVAGGCVMPSKTCDPGCENRGVCRLRNVNSGVTVLSCALDDLYCVAQCDCQPGYFGSSCELTRATRNARNSARHLLLDAFVNQTLLEDQSDDVVASWISSVSLLSVAGAEFDEIVVNRLAAVMDTVLDGVQLISLPYSQLLPLSAALDSLLLGVQALNATTASADMAAQVARVALIVERFADLVALDMTAGQSDVSSLSSELRLVVRLTPVYATATHQNVVSLPQTSLEVFSGRLSDQFSVPSFHSSGSGSLIVSAYSINSAAVQNVSSLLSNPTYFRFDSESGRGISVTCASTADCEVQIVFQHNQHVSRIRPFEQITETACFDRDYFVQNYSCLTSSQHRTINCPGVPGAMVDRCPILNSTTACMNLMGSGGAIASGYRSCRVVDFSDFNVTCACRIDRDGVTGTTRRLSGVTNVTSVSLAYAATPALYTYNFDRFFVPNDHTSVIVDSTIALYGMSLLCGFAILFMCGLFTSDKRDDIKKSLSKLKRHKTKLSLVAADKHHAPVRYESSLEADEEAHDNRVFLFDAEDSETGERKESDDKLPELVIRPVSKSAPRVLTAASLTATIPRILWPETETWTRVWDEFLVYHRWIALFTHSSAQFSRRYRMCVLGSQIVIPLFLQALIFHYTNPHDDSCQWYADERTCLSRPSDYVKHYSQCVWLYSSHTCHFRQPNPSVQFIIVTVLVSALISVPLTRCVEHLLVKVAMPHVGEVLEEPRYEETDAENWVSPGRTNRRLKPSPAASPHRMFPSSPHRSLFPSITPHAVHAASPTAATVGAFHPASSVMSAAAAEEGKEVHAQFVNKMPVESEVELLQLNIKNYSEALTYLGNAEDKLTLMNSWGVDNHFAFIRSAVLSPEAKQCAELEDRSDVLLAAEVKQCRKETCVELAVLQQAEHLSSAHDERRHRLFYLLQRDMLGSRLGGRLLDNKAERDAFFVDCGTRQHYASYKYRVGGSRLYQWTKPLILLALLSAHVLMLVYVGLFFLDEPEQRQKAWLYSLIAWLAMDFAFVSSLEVLVLQVALPWLLLPDMLGVHKAVTSLVRDFHVSVEKARNTENYREQQRRLKQEASGGRLLVINTQWDRRDSDAPPANSLHSHHEEALTVNAAQFFFVSFRLAAFFGLQDDPLQAGKLVLSYATSLPPGHALGSSILRPLNAMLALPPPEGWSSRVEAQGSDLYAQEQEGQYTIDRRAAPEVEQSALDWTETALWQGCTSFVRKVQLAVEFVVSGRMLLVALDGFLRLSPLLQNIAVQSVAAATIASLALLHLYLYREALYLLFIPLIVCVALVVLILLRPAIVSAVQACLPPSTQQAEMSVEVLLEGGGFDEEAPQSDDLKGEKDEEEEEEGDLYAVYQQHSAVKDGAPQYREREREREAWEREERVVAFDEASGSTDQPVDAVDHPASRKETPVATASPPVSASVDDDDELRRSVSDKSDDAHALVVDLVQLQAAQPQQTGQNGSAERPPLDLTMMDLSDEEPQTNEVAGGGEVPTHSSLSSSSSSLREDVREEEPLPLSNNSGSNINVHRSGDVSPSSHPASRRESGESGDRDGSKGGQRVSMTTPSPPAVGEEQRLRERDKVREVHLSIQEQTDLLEKEWLAAMQVGGV